METQDALPYVATAALGLAGIAIKASSDRASIRATAQSNRDAARDEARSGVAIADIHAHSTTEGHLWDYLKTANERHEKDIVRLNTAVADNARLTGEIIVLRGRIEWLEAEIASLKKKNA